MYGDDTFNFVRQFIVSVVIIIIISPCCSMGHVKPHQVIVLYFSQLIYVGEYSQAMDQNWHPGHLCCYFCDESLSQQRFVTVEGQPACVSCYDKRFANNCENCKKPIGPGTKDVDVRGKHWHEECFVCSQPDCNKPLVSSS